MNSKKTKKILFVLRRACWLGRTRNSDLTSMFGMTGATARNIMNEAVKKWPQVLYNYKKSGVFKRDEAVIPREASAETMMALFENHAKPDETGLTEEESSVFFPLYPPKNRPLDGLETILNYNIKARQAYLQFGREIPDKALVIEILYVGLKKDDFPRWRKIVCNGLEYNGQVWRLIAQEISSTKYTQKNYVLSRIIDARPTPILTPKDFQFEDVKENLVKIDVLFNELLTTDQRKVLKNELDVRDGKILIPEKELFYFKRYYQDNKDNMEHIVWPLITYSKET